MKNKTAVIIATLVVLYFLNSCSCPLWFNNGCRFNETWLGSIFK